jgi:hypothetical protein
MATTELAGHTDTVVSVAFNSAGAAAAPAATATGGDAYSAGVMICSLEQTRPGH